MRWGVLLPAVGIVSGNPVRRCFWRVDYGYDDRSLVGFIAIVDESEFDREGSFLLIDVTVCELRFIAGFLPIKLPFILIAIVAKIQLVLLNRAVAIENFGQEMHYRLSVALGDILPIAFVSNRDPRLRQVVQVPSFDLSNTTLAAECVCTGSPRTKVERGR
jgi:hypothetical protein